MPPPIVIIKRCSDAVECFVICVTIVIVVHSNTSSSSFINNFPYPGNLLPEVTIYVYIITIVYCILLLLLFCRCCRFFFLVTIVTIHTHTHKSISIDRYVHVKPANIIHLNSAFIKTLNHSWHLLLLFACLFLCLLFVFFLCLFVFFCVCCFGVDYLFCSVILLLSPSNPLLVLVVTIVHQPSRQNTTHPLVHPKIFQSYLYIDYKPLIYLFNLFIILISTRGDEHEFANVLQKKAQIKNK